MLFGDRPIIKEEAGPWSLEFTESIGADGSYLCTSVQLCRDGSQRGRLSLVRSGMKPEEAVDQLRPRALAWIADYEARPHTGDTHFGALAS